jgi:putative ABC transport system permease protein
MLRAIGMAKVQIVKTVMGQAAFIGLLGIAAGAVAGLVLARSINWCLGALYGHPVAFAMRPDFAVLLLTLALAVVFIAALVPARRAAKVNPIQAMRQD